MPPRAIRDHLPVGGGETCLQCGSPTGRHVRSVPKHAPFPLVEDGLPIFVHGFPVCGYRGCLRRISLSRARASRPYWIHQSQRVLLPDAHQREGADS